GGQLTIAGYIDHLVESEAFASNVAPLAIVRQLLSQNALGAPEGFILRRTDGDQPVYYLHEPCTPDKAVSVRPWWSLLEGRDEAVRICPDSYRPEQWTADVAKGEPETSCVSEAAQTETHGCGCGPNLMRC